MRNEMEMKDKENEKLLKEKERVQKRLNYTEN